ncbi:ion transport protein [Nitzschia inconspicua]|uniref:Ion transport protein n=1 Tax=Nitzschia inconspicua TaxID=303405 RepID=A0A9K3PL13_9STRA|nr:ion transport protein [Nitzschia inconspicua]
MADVTAGTKSTRFKRRLGEGLTVELIFTPSDNTPNPIANDGHLWSGNETTSIDIDRPSVRQSPSDTEENEGLLQIDLTNFTGRLSFRKIETNEGEISGVDYSTTPPEIIECPPTFEEINSTLTEQQQAQQPINFIQVDDSLFERLLSSSVMTDDHAVMGDEFSGVSSPIHENSSIRLQPSFMPATTEVERDLTVSTLSSNDLKAVGKAGAPLSAGKFPFLRNRVKPVKNPTSEDTKQNSVTNTISNALRYRRNKRMSMFTIMKRESVRSLPSSVLMSPTKEEKDGQTELHILVSSADLTLKSLEETIERFPESVSTPDGRGRLPLHALGSNSDLVNYPEGQAIAKQCAILLMELYPTAIITKDENGRMPFTYLIEKWVEWTHQQDSAKQLSRNHQDSGEAISGFFRKLLGSWSRSSRHTDPTSTTETLQSLKSLSDSSNRFPPVIIFEEVEWCFDILSLAMDHLGGMPFDQKQNLRKNLSHKKQREERMVLATNVASIPQLLKTAMLLDSNETRQNILDSSVIRRALLCPEVIGPWLTSMLRHKKGKSSMLAIELLVMFSQLSVEDHVGKYRKVLPFDEELFKADKLKVFEAVENLRDIVPSLLILPNDQLDQAIATPVIWFCMNRHTTSPFSVGMSSTDFQLQITTIIAVRQGLFLLNTDGVFPIVFPQLTIVSVVFFGCFFQVIRILCEAMALKQISTQVALRYCRDPWRIFHFVGVFAAMWASVQYKIRIDNGFYEDESNFDGDTPPLLMAIIIGLLWFSVLGFLKAVNESLATFILALTRIFFDIRFFCIVLLVFILMFGDMFHLLYLEDPALKAECNSNDPSDPASDFCSERLVYSYLRVYAMMIEDFNLVDFQQSPAQTILWLVVTFVGFVVMMNTLIAVITRSYERSQNSSIILFRRARCEFVASNAAIEGFLRPEFFDRHANRNCDLSSILLASARWILLLTFFVTISISSLYLIQLLVEVIEAKNWIATIAAVVFCLIMTFNIWSSFAFIFNALLRICSGEWAEKTRNGILSTNQYIVEKMAAQIFGIDARNTDGGEMIVTQSYGGHEKELYSRIDKLEKMLDRLVTQEATREAVNSIQPHVN